MDIALAVEQLLGEGIEFGSATDYVALQRSWRDTRHALPSLAALQAAWDAYVASEAAKQEAAETLKQLIRTTAQGAVGKRLDTLTAAEQRALLAVLLWQAGGVSNDGTVKALSAWV